MGGSAEVDSPHIIEIEEDMVFLCPLPKQTVVDGMDTGGDACPEMVHVNAMDVVVVLTIMVEGGGETTHCLQA